MPFRDRQEAGELLAKQLVSYRENPIVFALPRGGVPIGQIVAQKLHAPLEVLAIRKVGAPMNPEYGIGAVTEGGVYWVDESAARTVGATPKEIEGIVRMEAREVERRVQTYRQGRSLPPLSGRDVILVDDGLATGVTARVAVLFLKKQGADKVILAVPVGSPSSVWTLRSIADEVICLEEPDNFYSVGQFYDDFGQVTDSEVMEILAQPRDAICEEVVFEDQERGVRLEGTLSIPSHARGIVIFAHGSGSSRLSPRNQQVANHLNEAGLGTLLFDLLSPEESEDRANVFDIPFLADRLALATRWLRQQSAARDLAIGYFGASTGGGAALWAAAEMGSRIFAVVSRGGRPDLAIPRLPKVQAPTLLIVGGDDEPVIEMNQEAMKHLATSRLVIVPGATHLFEEPGALERVAEEAANWFNAHLPKAEKRAA